MEGFTYQADKALLDTVFDGVVVIDLKHLRISLANKAAADILGFSDPDDLVGLDPLKHIPSEDRENMAAMLAGLVSGGRLQAGAEIRVLDKRGKDVWITARGVRLASNGNSVLLASFRDITAQKTAEMALCEAEKSQVDLLNASSELILISQDWRIVFTNRSLQEAMGLSAEALAGMSILDLTHPDDRKAVKRRYQQTLDGKYRPSNKAFKGIGKGGKTSWGMMRHVPFTWQGKPALITIVQDITRQKIAEEALQESERRYRLIAENMTDVVWALDMNLKTIFVSPSVEQQKGYTVEEAMALTLEEQMTPDTLARVREVIAEELMLEETGSADPHRARTAEGETYRKDGSKFWVEVTASFLRDQQGKPIGIMGITRDISERKKAEGLQKLAAEVLGILNEPLALPDAVNRILAAIKRETGFDAVGIRLKNDHDFPYLVQTGFSEDFLMTENTLAVRGPDGEVCLDENGDVSLECTCGLVLSGKTDPDNPLFTPGGSAWTNDSIPLLDIPLDQDPRLHPRNRCIHAGFQSVALMPIRRGEEIVGLLQLNDRRKECFSPEIIRFFEGIAASIGVALMRKRAEQALLRVGKAIESSSDAIGMSDAEGHHFYHNKAFSDLFEYTSQELEAAGGGPVAYADQNVARQVFGAIMSGRSWNGEVEMVSKGGRTFPVLLCADAIKDESGRVIGLVGVHTDITERKKAEKAIQESEEKFRALVENAAAVVFSLDNQGNITYISPAIERLSGYKADEVIGRSCTDYVVPEDLPGLMESMLKTLSGELEPYEFRVKGRDGVAHHVLTSSRPIIHEGAVRGLIGVMVDITEAKAAQEALKVSEARYRLLATNASDIIWVTDANLKISYTSPSATALLGYSLEEVTERSIDRLITPASMALVSEVLREDLAREEKMAGSMGDRTLEIEVVRKEGSTVWLEAAVRVIRDEQGQFCGFQGACRDITQRKRAEEALKDSEAVYKRLFENTQTAMEVISGETGLVVLANETTARMFGFDSAEELIGVDSMEYLRPEDRDRVAAEMARAIAEDDRSGATEMSVRTKDGRWLWINALVTYTEHRGKTDLLVSLIDLTSRKQAEQTLQESEEKSRLLIENAGEAIIVVQDGVLKFANPKCTEISGYKCEELISTDFLDVVHPDDRQAIGDNYFKRLSGEEVPNNYRFRILDKAGDIKWLQINTVRFGWEGRPAILAMLTDVTAQKKAEEALQESESRYRLIAENSSDVIWTMDMDLRMTYVSPSIEKLTGYTVEESIRMKIEDGLTPASLQRAAQTYTQGLRDLESNGGKPTSPVAVELEFKRKDGSTAWTEVQMSFMQDSQGKVFGIMGVARDIDERRRSRMALEESEQRFRALIEGARDAIAVIDLNGKVTYRSPSAERITDGVPDDLLTISLQERLHPDDVAKATRIFESLMRSLDGTVVDVELRYRRADGSWGVVEARGTNRVHDPKIGGIVVNYRDITERRKAEEAFLGSENRYRMLAENVSDVIWSLNMKSKKPFFSPSVTRLLGYTVEEAQSMRMRQVVSPTSYPKAMMAFSNLLGKQGNGSNGRASSTQLEVELVRKDGSVVWVDIAVTLLRDADGQPGELFGVMRDVTQRKKVEEDLRTSEEYFRALIENAWDAIAIVDAHGTMLYESPSSARIMGYEPEEIVGKNLADFVRPEDIASIADTFRRFRTEPGAIVMVDAGFRHKDGHYIECEGTLQNFLNDPKINGIVANYRDVTDRRRVEEAIRNSEERFRNLVEATSDWVWEVDANGVYTYASPNVREVMGYDVSEVIGRSISDFMPAREANRFSKTFKSHAARKEPFTFVEGSRLHRDGRVIIMETSGVPFLGDDGSLLGYRGIGRDITNRKKVEKDLETSLKKVEKTMEAAIQAISYTMETRDPYTTGHQRRVTQLACAIAKEMGVAPWQVDGIRVAGLLHDIGKIAVPTEILSKPGKLSDIEFSMIKAHPKVGFDILKNVEFEWPIARIVVQHHERLNGSGYPFGLQGKDILQESRILAVADVVEAMSSHRPYRPALGIEKALAEVVRGEGTLYDSEVVRACAKVVRERGFKFEG